MCVLIASVGETPWLAANRDEAYARPFRGPVAWPGDTVFWAPRDEQAGGTWLGVNANGLIAAITNRSRLPERPGLPSRGALVTGALAQPSLDAARAWLQEELQGAARNPFQLCVLHGAGAFVCIYGPDGKRIEELAPGVHVLSNLHERGEIQLDALQADASRVTETLCDHTPRLGGGHAICKHGESRGTVASALIEPDVRFLFAAGPPCETPFEPVAGYPG